MPEQDWDWEQLAGPDTITEGPAWDGSGLFYTEHRAQRDSPVRPGVRSDRGRLRRLRRHQRPPVRRRRPPLRLRGRAPRDRRLRCRGQPSDLVDRFEGKRLNSPNDLALDRQGRIWFTDPRYGRPRRTASSTTNRSTASPRRATGDGAWPIERMTFDTTKPNGLLLSPDERTLYVAQSDYCRENPGPARLPGPGRRHARRSAASCTISATRAASTGMCFDTEGNIVATCGWGRSRSRSPDRRLRPGRHHARGGARARRRSDQLRLRRRRPERPLRDHPRRPPLPRPEQRTPRHPPTAYGQTVCGLRAKGRWSMEVVAELRTRLGVGIRTELRWPD